MVGISGGRSSATCGPSAFRPSSDGSTRWTPVIEDQFARRGPSAGRPANMPLSTGGLEQLARPVKNAIYERRFVLKNRERLNRLLMLMQLHVDGHDSQVAHTTAIRNWLIANQGRPLIGRRDIADARGNASLR
jgi:hypothetical protein